MRPLCFDELSVYYELVTTTADIFDQILWTFRLDNPNYNRVLDGDDFVETVKNTAAFKRKKGFHNPFAATATKITRELKRERRPKSFMDQLRKSIATALVESAGHRYSPRDAPKIHHWIPICYLSQFTRGLEQRDSRGALIPMMDFSKTQNKNIIVGDKTFAHSARGGVGFFELTAERFFGIIESRYCNALMRLEPGVEPYRFQMISYVSMLLIQHLRAPRAGEFQFKDLHEFARALEELLDSIEEGHAYIEFSDEPFPFTPSTPTRERHFSDGGRAWHFPLSSNATLIFADRKLTEAERARMAEGSRISTVKTAKRNGTPLYGALMSDFD